MKSIKRMMFYTPPMFSRLTALVEKTGLSLTEIVRRAIDDYLSKIERAK